MRARARQILEHFLSDGHTVTFNSLIDEKPVVVEATVSHEEGAPGSLSHEPGWYVEIDQVKSFRYDRTISVDDLDRDTIHELERQAIRAFQDSLRQ